MKPIADGEKDGTGILREDGSAAHARAVNYDLIAIVASKGGIQAVSRVLAALPPDFPIPIVIVIHRGASLPNYQARVVQTSTVLPVRFAAESVRIKPGVVYVAPPHPHLTIDRAHRFMFVDSRKIRHLRSSANPLFSSAAEIFGPRLMAVVLTGLARDGTDGVQTVKKHGGTVIAQNEDTCEEFSMPRSAIETGCVDLVLPIEEIGPTLVRLAIGERPVRPEGHGAG